MKKVKIIGFGTISLGVCVALTLSAIGVIWIDGYTHPYLSLFFRSFYYVLTVAGFYQCSNMYLSMKADRKLLDDVSRMQDHYLRQLEAILTYHKAISRILNDPAINYDSNLLREKLLEAAQNWQDSADWNMTRYNLEKPDEH